MGSQRVKHNWSDLARKLIRSGTKSGKEAGGGVLYNNSSRGRSRTERLKKRHWPSLKVAQSCPTLCNPMDYTVHGILQARILEWVAIPFSSESSLPRNWTGVSCIAGRFFTDWGIRESHIYVCVSICRYTYVYIAQKEKLKKIAREVKAKQR